MRHAIRTKRETVVLIVLSVLWGSTWAAIRVTVMHMPPLRSVAIRFLLASAVLVPATLLWRRRLPRGREWLLLAVLGALMVALPFSLIAWTQTRMSSGVTSLLFAAAPLLTLWMETWMGGPNRLRQMPARAVVGSVVGLGGVALVLVHAASTLEREMWPALVVLLVVTAGSASSIIAKQRLKEIPVLTVAATETLLAGLMLSGLSLGLEQHRATHWTAMSVSAMLFLGLVSSAFCFLLYYWLLMRIEPYQLAATHLMMPIVAVGEGTLLLHEAVSGFEVAGGVAVLMSLGLVLSAERGGEPQRVSGVAVGAGDAKRG